MRVFINDIGNVLVLVEHFLVVTSALVGTSGSYEVAHHNLYFDFPAFLQGQIKQTQISKQKLDVSCVLLLIPAIGPITAILRSHALKLAMVPVELGLVADCWKFGNLLRIILLQFAE